MLSGAVQQVKKSFAPMVKTFGHHKDELTEKVIILGAAGRDFHDFITYWSKQPNVEVVCFTAAQIPGIDDRTFPSEMCNNDLNNNRYPNGVKIFPEDKLEELVARFGATTVAMAYSDLSYDTVQSLASRANAAGCKFVQLPPHLTMVESSKPVISVCASRTGVGKSQATRYVAKYFKDKGMKVAAIRHPMPYDKNLLNQRCQRYEKMEDMDKYDCTIEEREEYFRHIEQGTLLFAGVDYPMILREAEKDADIIIWDGGNNDLPFYKPNLHICLVDSLRPSDEIRYFPGETNVRMADVVLVCKVNSPADKEKALKQAEKLKNITKPDAPIFLAGSVVTAEGHDLKTEEASNLVKGKRVLVIDDGPTLTHGGMVYGAGYVLATDLGASEIVDPRPSAQGSLKKVFEKFPHLKNVLPAMGYGKEQVKDLEATIHAVECDTIIFGTPSDIARRMDLKRPSVVARYELELDQDDVKAFHDTLNTFTERFE
ncbi:hypothetical protein FisN_21Lh147 [Fistulifera solaris]|uniref:GTPase n=1 Tax=Fistulifera solaris TaxID=1519565 RepID=A0A1Z5J919_FISSO|nr:hypothetical protein FisN_21Lh147 [Fistulifera solaris]|eukprot:GAX10449.1 hypothetical protein FisN_21Lh147 [Fistulifera solaris]